MSGFDQRRAPLVDRRQRAREAFLDYPDDDLSGALDDAIETATRVKITPELLATMDPAVGNRETRLLAAFRAAGFEVEQ